MPPKFSHPEDQQDRNLKTLVFLAFSGLAFLVLLGRMFQLQHLDYQENLKRSENNRMKEVIVKAERGYILDRNGEVLVRNRPSYQISILPYQLKQRDTVFQRLMQITDTSGQRIFDSTFVDFMFQRGKWVKFRPLRILEDAPISWVSLI